MCVGLELDLDTIILFHTTDNRMTRNDVPWIGIVVAVAVPLEAATHATTYDWNKRVPNADQSGTIEDDTVVVRPHTQVAPIRLLSTKTSRTSNGRRKPTAAPRWHLSQT